MNEEKISTDQNQLFGSVKIFRSDNVLLRIIETIALAEISQQNAREEKPWINEEKLNKRRAAYGFDEEIQCMVNHVGRYGDFTSGIISCGSSGYYRTELKNSNNVFLHFFQNFYRLSKYVQAYIKKNEIINAPNYAFFHYTISENKISDIELEFPYENDLYTTKYNLSACYQEIKNNIKSKDVAQMLKTLKEGETITSLNSEKLMGIITEKEQEATTNV